MSQIIYTQGKATIVIPAGESIAVYTRGSATVKKDTAFPAHPNSEITVGVVQNGQTIFGAYSTGATIIIYAGNADVLYEVGTDPVVQEKYATQIQAVPTAVDVTGAVSAEAMLAGIVTSAAATVAGTIPAGTVMEAAAEFAIGDSFDWSVIKVGANDFTVTAASGHTIVGVAVVATATSGLFRTKKTAADTFVTYRIG